MEHRCPKCASSELTLLKEMPFAFQWSCLRCAGVFSNPRISVVLVDPNETRRHTLVSSLEHEDVPVLAAGRLAEIETWPVGKVLVTDVNSCPRFHTGATHLVVIGGSEEDRVDAARTAGAPVVAVNNDPAAVISALRRIAATNSAAGSTSVTTNRRSGLPERRRYTRRDRRR